MITKTWKKRKRQRLIFRVKLMVKPEWMGLDTAINFHKKSSRIKPRISWDWRANEDVAIKIVWRVNGESEWNRRKLMTSTQDFKTLKNDVILNETSPEFMLCLNSRKKRIWLHIIIPKRTLKNLLLFRNCKKKIWTSTNYYVHKKENFIFKPLLLFQHTSMNKLQLLMNNFFLHNQNFIVNEMNKAFFD